MRTVYLDHAATTYLDPAVFKAMAPFWNNIFGNPSALYREGRRAKQALGEARASIARILNCSPGEIVFTGGGTESDNLAILGIAKAREEAGLATKSHLVTSAIEHHAVLRAAESLEKQGYTVTYLPVTPDGLVDPDMVRSAIRPETLLVSIMYANNEIGTIQPIAEIGRICRERGIYFHTDACQAAGALPLDVNRLGVDLLTLNGSKVYGPKGVGLLYIKQGTRIAPLIYGGGQERRLRSGTENIPGIIGLATALKLAAENRVRENARLTKLRDYFIDQIMRRIPKVRLNGHPTQRLPNNVNVSILDIEGEAFILSMDRFGIACATGSACDSATLEPSHVITALGLPYEFAHSALRFTLGKQTTRADLDYTLAKMIPVVKRLRRLSPVHVSLEARTVTAPKAFIGQNFPIKARSRRRQ